MFETVGTGATLALPLRQRLLDKKSHANHARPSTGLPPGGSDFRPRVTAPECAGRINWLTLIQLGGGGGVGRGHGGSWVPRLCHRHPGHMCVPQPHDARSCPCPPQWPTRSSANQICSECALCVWFLLPEPCSVSPGPRFRARPPNNQGIICLRRMLGHGVGTPHPCLVQRPSGLPKAGASGELVLFPC